MTKRDHLKRQIGASSEARKETVKDGEQAFGGSPEVWLAMQMQYDLAQAEKKAAKIKVQRIAPAAA